MRYAQIDLKTGICFSVSDLSGEVIAPDMILITDGSFPLGKKYENGAWVVVPAPDPGPSVPTPEERIAELSAVIDDMILNPAKDPEIAEIKTVLDDLILNGGAL